MNLNRQRNIYTLGSPEKSKPRQLADPFERDPFKINSYNFRYADRPSFQMPVLRQRANNQEFLKDCQTYFYNYNFATTNNSKTERTGPLQSDKIKLNLTNFQEYRRRRFLSEAESHRNCNLTITKENSSNLNRISCTSKLLNTPCNEGNDEISQAYLKKNNFRRASNSNNSLTNNCSQSSVRNDIKPESAKGVVASAPIGSISADRIRSLGSGCEISINIKSLNNNSLHKNVNIKIETDSVCRNLNTPFTKTLKQSNAIKSRVEQLYSSGTFVVDKRLSSKSLSNQDRENDALKTENDYTKELTSIYSSQRLTKSPKGGHVTRKSTERLPSLIPFSSRGSKQNLSSRLPKENFANNKPLIQRVDNKATEKGFSHNNYNRSPNNLTHGGTKISGSSSLTDYLKKPRKPNQASRISSKSSSPNRTDLKSTRSTVRLPLNVTINVITDKLKLLKV